MADVHFVRSARASSWRKKGMACDFGAVASESTSLSTDSFDLLMDRRHRSLEKSCSVLGEVGAFRHCCESRFCCGQQTGKQEANGR